MKGENMRSRFLGANHCTIQIGGDLFLQSYNVTVVKIASNGETFLDCNYWDYSKTTGKYRNQFLGKTKVETARKIMTGQYKLVNLN
jgi:hypothetical protein